MAARHYITRFIPLLMLLAFGANAQEPIDFGDDSSRWANDGECDDPRFEGDGVASILLDEDLYRDATDCRDLYDRGRIDLREISRGASAGNRIERGQLRYGDEQLNSGEYADIYTFRGQAGEHAIIDVRSQEFDTYLMVIAPSGEQVDNDDHEGDRTRSLVSLPLSENGNYRVYVTSYEPGEVGSYTLSINSDSAPSGGATLNESGALQAGDATLSSGEYIDSYYFEGLPGERVDIDLTSSDFDTYLILVTPSYEQIENDDWNGDTSRSFIQADLTEPGTYRVVVTSFEPGERGAYRMTMSPSSDVIAADYQAPDDGGAQISSRDSIELTIGRRTEGVLSSDDALLVNGEYNDVYVFDANAGEDIEIDLQSAEFDTYLVVESPSGQTFENDDFNSNTAQSVVRLTARESGRYRVMVTSYAAREMGQYELLVTTSPAGRIYGVFIGISDYPGEDADLMYTAEDAYRAHEAMVSAGMDPNDGFILTDADATVGNVESTLSRISAISGPNDTVVFFYSGHGDREARPEGPQFPMDPDALDETLVLYDGYVTDDQLADMFFNVTAETTLIVLDACFSGGFAKDLISVPGRMGLFSSEEDVLSAVAHKFQAGGYLSQFFSEAVAEGLADTNADGGITALELSEYIHARYRSEVMGKAGGPDEGNYVRLSDLGYQHLVVDRGGVENDRILFAVR
ncbi:MAG: caspase family protein [Woeseiaceae bacterium]|nr:caspase family protein [Woeseiaceae bacterium]